jgi:ATP-dependent helicase/nuclease subunit A
MQPLRNLPPEKIRRELPFTLQLGERTINGQIDVLYLDRSGDWTVLDYKTDDVRLAFIPIHARRYFGQVGVYALAVQAIVGPVPRVQLYYARSATLFTVKESDWRDAIARLDTDLRIALE